MSAADDGHPPVGHGLSRSLKIFQDFESGEASRGAHDSTARMGGRSAQIKIFDGRAELGVSRHRAKKEKLLERKFALKNIAFAKAEIAFQNLSELMAVDAVTIVGLIPAELQRPIVYSGAVMSSAKRCSDSRTPRVISVKSTGTFL